MVESQRETFNYPGNRPAGWQGERSRGQVEPFERELMSERDDYSEGETVEGSEFPSSRREVGRFAHSRYH